MKTLLLLAISSVLAFAQGTAADAVKAAEKSWARATVAGDAAALDQLLADDLSYTHSNGETDDKRRFIGNLKSVRKYHKLDHEATDVRLYGNIAVLTTTARVATSRNGGQPEAVHLRFIHVWLQQGATWRLVAHQSLRLAD